MLYITFFPDYLLKFLIYYHTPLLLDNTEDNINSISINNESISLYYKIRRTVY